MPLAAAAVAVGVGLEAASAAGAFGSQPGVPRGQGILNKAEANQTQYEKSFLEFLNTNYPQLTKLAQTTNQGGNQFALQQQQQFGLPAGQAVLDAQKKLAPGFYKNQDALAGYLGSQVGKGLSPEETQFFNQQLMGNEAAMGLGSSPLGAQNAAYQLTGLDLGQRNTNVNQLQQFLNSYQLPGVPNIFGPEAALGATSAAQLGGASLSSLSPQDMLSLQANLAGLKFAQQSQQANAQNAAVGQIGGTIAGLGMGGMRGAGGFSQFFGGGANISSGAINAGGYSLYPGGAAFGPAR